ncbi:hypothetical protein G6L15_08725 [Agrobacterium rhizogenes]|uniref:hypothetical protein n=1 Tax=Rhizobium rhizogenes TaxID=359 RepID=UPI001572B5E9|nr:hypothetical protein [Rhizobium rhizogenes]NTG86229.1 hypothetical protein [Rhizobium rhizogenes]
MEECSKWSDRVHWLSHHKGEIACFWCPKCRKGKNYEVDSMLKVLGDINVPSLPDVVAKAVGCLDFAKVGWDRCKMAPAWPRFHKIEWTPEVKVPRGYLALGERTLGGISEWEIVFGKCCCGWLHYVDVKAMIRKYGKDAKTIELERRLYCRRCETRGRAIFIFRNEKR